MGWYNLDGLELTTDISYYSNLGLYDYSSALVLPAEYLNNFEISCLPYLFNKWFLEACDVSSDYSVSDCLLLIVAYCKYINVESVFEYCYHFPNIGKSYYYLMKILNKSAYFKSISFNEQGLGSKKIYTLSKKGIERVLTLVPDELLPVDFKSKKGLGIAESNSYVFHDYYCGYNFLAFFFSGLLRQYQREVVFRGAQVHDYGKRVNRNDWASNTADTIRADAAAIISFEHDPLHDSILYIEQDMGTESDITIFKKYEDYFLASYIGQPCTHSLVFSFHKRFFNFIDSEFPYLFSFKVFNYVLKLINHFDCDLNELYFKFVNSGESLNDVYNGVTGKKCFSSLYSIYVCDFPDDDEIKNDSMMGNVSLKEFFTIIDYDGKIPVSILKSCIACMRSLLILFSLPDIEDCLLLSLEHIGQKGVFKKYENEIASGRISKGLVQDYGKYLELTKANRCSSVYYNYLKELREHAECFNRRSKLIKFITAPFLDKPNTTAISDFHRAAMAGSEMFFVPTMGLVGYLQSILPRQFYYYDILLSKLKLYYSDIVFKNDVGLPLTTGEEYPDLFLRSFFFSGGSSDQGGKEIYVENIYSSVSAMFRVKMLVEKYCRLDISKRDVVVVCVVDSYVDAINFALYINYWDKISFATDDFLKIDVCPGCLDVVFCNKDSLLSVSGNDEILYRVIKTSDCGNDVSMLYGYGTSRGLYHATVDFYPGFTFMTQKITKNSSTVSSDSKNEIRSGAGTPSARIRAPLGSSL